MGCAGSCPAGVRPRRHGGGGAVALPPPRLELDLAAARRISILLVGGAESGKSTFMKQMKLAYGAGFSEQERMLYRKFVYQNVVEGVRVLVDARERLVQCTADGRHYEWQRPMDSGGHATALLVFCADHGNVRSLDPRTFATVAPHAAALWRDQAIRRAYDRRNTIATPPPDSLEYFMRHVRRLSQPDYVPTDSDVILCRRPTRNIDRCELDVPGGGGCDEAPTSVDVDERNVPFRFTDMGGHPEGRQRLFEVFDGTVTAVLFFIALSDYDQQCAEDPTMTRFDFACQHIYAPIVNSPFCPPLILFMNKKDRLEAKVRQRANTVRQHCADLPAGSDAHNAVHVREHLLRRVRRHCERQGGADEHAHYTNATDAHNVIRVFRDVSNIIRRHLGIVEHF